MFAAVPRPIAAHAASSGGRKARPPGAGGDLRPQEAVKAPEDSPGSLADLITCFAKRGEKNAVVAEFAVMPRLEVQNPLR